MKHPLVWFGLWAFTMAIVSGIVIREQFRTQVEVFQLRLDALEQRLRVSPLDTLCTLTAELRDVHDMLAGHNRDSHPQLPPDPPMMSPEVCKGYVLR